jgi:transposase
MRLRRSRLSEEQTERLLRSFVAGTAARRAAQAAGVNRHTATFFYHRLRQVIARHLPRIDGDHDAAELEAEALRAAHDGARLTPLFGVIERAGRIYTVLPARTPRAAAPRRAPQPHVDALVCRCGTARRATLRLVPLRAGRAADARAPLQVREFWCRAQKQLGRFRGVPRQHLELYVKECEWRFNYGSEHRLLQTLRLWLRADRPARSR